MGLILFYSIFLPVICFFSRCRPFIQGWGISFSNKWAQLIYILFRLSVFPMKTAFLFGVSLSVSLQKRIYPIRFSRQLFVFSQKMCFLCRVDSIIIASIIYFSPIFVFFINFSNTLSVLHEIGHLLSVFPKITYESGRLPI